MQKKKIKPVHYFILTLWGILLLFIIRAFYIENKISRNGQIIIAKFTSKEKKLKTTNFYFTYFINNKKHSSSNTGIKYSILNSEKETQLIDSLKLNGFYYAKFLPEHPNTIIVDPSIEVKDSIKIKLAGF